MTEIKRKPPYRRVLALDFETAWSKKEYSLSFMTTEEYIRDPRFKAWGCSYYFMGEGDVVPTWVSHADLPAFFKSIDWGETAVIAHNSQFDVAILAWIYGCYPRFIFDTLSMARALYGIEVGNSLAKLAAHFKLPPKGRALNSTDGLFGALPAHVEHELAEYCNHDTFLCVGIFDTMVENYPAKELRLIDMTLQMYVKPVIELDKEMLVDALEEERGKREGLLQRLAISEKDIASNPKFADILRRLGIEPPMKKKPATLKNPNPAGLTYAFAKNDAAFQALLGHEREDVSLLCEARVAVKSTQGRTRAQRFLEIAGRGALPVPLKYYGAHTGRWSASGSLNLQNLKRGSTLRSAMCAPAGYTFVVADLSQIEVRVLAWLADHRSMLEMFTKGGDPYALFGAQMFAVPGLTKESHPLLRQAAKSALLGAGYNLGWASFAAQLLTGFLGAPPTLYGIDMAEQVGATAEDVYTFTMQPGVAERIADIPHLCTSDELVVHCAVAAWVIKDYRWTARPVVDLWGRYGDLIGLFLYQAPQMRRFNGQAHSSAVSRRYKCLDFRAGEIVLPSGLSLRYPDLIGKSDEKGRVQWSYGEHRKKLYGGKVVENVTQALARLVMTDGLLRVQDRYPCVLTVHDEGVFLVPDGEVEEGAKWVREQMLKEPSYMPGIPLEVSVGSGKRYGDAK